MTVSATLPGVGWEEEAGLAAGGKGCWYCTEAGEAKGDTGGWDCSAGRSGGAGLPGVVGICCCVAGGAG